MAGLGSFVWFDLMTPSTEASVAFYTHVVGWGVQPMEGPMPYTLWTAARKPIGGVMSMPPEAGVPPHWLGYVGVADITASTERVGALGGRVVRPVQTIPGTGAFSIVTDPQGAAFALFASERPEDAPLPRGTPGLVSWAELNTTDYEGAFKFYAALLDWKPTSSMDMGPGLGTYFMFDRAGGDGTSMGGMSNAATMMKVPAHWLYYVNVEALDPALERVRERGGAVLNGPMEVPGGARIAQCKDPQGAFFALYSEG